MLRLATYNIRFGGVGRASIIANVLKGINADIVLLVEANDESVLNEIASSQGMFLTRAKGKRAELAVLSKTQPRSWETYYPYNSGRPLLKVEFSISENKTFTLHGCHLQHHYFRWNEVRRIADIESYLSYMSHASQEPHILLGDFNAIAPNDPFDMDGLPLKEKLMVLWEKGRIYREAIQKLQTAGYVDCFRTSHSLEAGFTLPTKSPHVRLDYIFANPAIAGSLIDCFVATSSQATTASDHYPVVAEFDL